MIFGNLGKKTRVIRRIMNDYIGRCRMMVLKNRKVAVLITIVVAVLATLFGVNRSLARLSRSIERMFYDGVYLESEKYTQPSLDSQIAKHTDATLGLATILTNYSGLHDDAEFVIALRRELLDAESIGDKSLAFWTMSRYVNSLVQATAEVGLSARDSDAVSQYSSTINGAEAFIRGAAYNQAVSKQWNEQSSIARAIGLLLPVREPEMF